MSKSYKKPQVVHHSAVAKTVSRPGVLGRPLPDVVILAAFCLILLIPFLVNNRTILPIDGFGVAPSGPYAYSEPRQPHRYTLDPDGAIGGDISWMAYTAESLKHGIIPFWNPYQSLGEPFLAEAGTQVLYPPNWLHVVTPTRYWDVLTFMHLFLASWFVCLFARECGLSRWPALLAGACVYAQGFFQGYLAIGSVLAACTWLPLILFGVERYFNGNRSTTSFLAISAGTFLLLTGGHPGLVIVAAVTVLAYLLLRFAMERNVWAVIAMLVPFAAGVLCAAPVWVPLMQNMLSVSAGLGPAPNTLGWRALPSLFFPNVYKNVYEPVFGNSSVTIGNGEYGWMPSAVVFLALAGMVAAIFRRDRKMLTLAGIALWFLLWMMDIRPFNLLRHVFLLRRLTLAYLLCSIQLSFCMLAGYGASAFLRASRRELAVIAGAWIAFAGACFSVVFSVLHSAVGPVDPDCLRAGLDMDIAWAIIVPVLLYGAVFLARHAARDLPIAVAFAVVIGSAIAFFPSGALYKTVYTTRLDILLAVIACALLAVWLRDTQRSVGITSAALLLLNVILVGDYPGWPKRVNPFAESPSIQYLKGLPQSGRVYGMQCILFPDIASQFWLPSINGLMTLMPERSIEFMMRYADTCQNPAAFYGLQYCPTGPLGQILLHRPVWDYLGVSDVLGINAAQIRDNVAAMRSPSSDYLAVPLQGSVRFPVLLRTSASAIEVLVGTGGRINHGPLRFQLKGANGETALSSEMDEDKLPAQDWAVFDRADGEDIPPGLYTAEIASPESPIVLWTSRARPGIYLHRAQTKDAGFRLASFIPADPVTVWENESAQPTLYVAPQSAPAAGRADAQAKLVAQVDMHHVAYREPGTPACASNASFPVGREASTLKSIDITPNRIHATIEAKSAGTLVYVGVYTKGWSARVDNQPSPAFPVNGAFLGTCLAAPGEHQVSFEYLPPLWYPSLGGAVLGFLVAGFGLRRAKARG